MKSQHWYYGIMLPVFFFLAGCATESTDHPEKKKQESSQVLSVETTPVKKEQSAYTISLPGELHPYEEVKLYAKIRGFVKKLYVDRGDQVKQGQLLAVLEAPEIMQKFVGAKAKQREVKEQLQYSLQAYNRMKTASQNAGAVAAIELDQAKARLLADSAAYLALQAEMEAAGQLKDYAYITAPFDGVITSRMISQGALVGENEQPLFFLSQQNRLRLTIAVPEKHARALHDSTRVTFTVNGSPGKIFEAAMSRSSKIIDPTLRALMVEFDIDNADNTLSGGEYAQVQINLSRSEPVLQVPVSSVIQTQNGVFVVKVAEQTIQHVRVEKGIQQDALIEIFGDLQAGDQVAVKGSEELREGMKVNTVQVTETTVSPQTTAMNKDSKLK